MPRISISYRRADTAGVTGRIFDRLKQHYGADSVFIDIDSMRMGRNYKKQIDTALSTTDVLLIIMGRQWLGPRSEGSNRILDAHDPVRLEVEAATRYERLVIPVLVDGSTMPDTSQLPESLAEFPFLQAAEVDSGRFFDRDIAGLIRSLDEEFEQQHEAQAAEQLRAAEQARQADELREGEERANEQARLEADRRDAEARAKEQARLEEKRREEKRREAETREAPSPLQTLRPLFLRCGALLLGVSLLLEVGSFLAEYHGAWEQSLLVCAVIDFTAVAILAVLGVSARSARLVYLLWCDAAANAALGVCLLPNLLNFRVNNASFFWLYCAAWIVSALVRGWTAWNTEGAVRFIALGTGLTLLVIGILLASQILPDHWLAILAFGSYDGVCGLGYLATALALRNGRNAAPSET